MTIKSWLAETTKKLTDAGISSARLDCLILLEYITKWDRAWILAHADISLDAISIQKLNDLLGRRLKREPIAYLTSHKEFMGLDLKVTPDVLIPRPETEQLIELFDSLNPQNRWQVVDIGTGSGAIALSIKHKHPSISVTATDTSPSALKIAKYNADNHKLAIHFKKTNLLDGLDTFDMIIANLPYIDANWEVSPETVYEPSTALFAATDGLELVYAIIKQALNHLYTDGYLLLEHDPRQSSSITQFSSQHGYQIVTTDQFATVLQRTTG